MVNVHCSTLERYVSQVFDVLHDDVQADFVTLTDTGQDVQGEDGYKVQKYGGEGVASDNVLCLTLDRYLSQVF